MKKIFISFFVLFSSYLWAQSLTDFYFVYGGDWYLRGGEKTGVHENMGTDMYAVYDADNGNKISRMSLFVDEFGYVKLMNEDTFYLILGHNIGHFGGTTEMEDIPGNDFVLPSFIKSISSPDFLTEKIAVQKQ